MHENQLCHFDIKPANVFYMEQNKVYFLQDFGGTVQVKDLSQRERFMPIVDVKEITPFYAAPEYFINAIVKSNTEYKINPYLFDMFSLGLTLSYVLLKKNPEFVKY